MPACRALFTLVLLPPKPAKYYTSLNSSTPQQLLHFYVAVIRPVLEYCAPVWHYEQLEWIQKWAIHIIYRFFSLHVLSQYYVRCWTVLPWIQTWPTFTVILSRYLSAILFPLSLLPHHVTSVLSRLRTATRFTVLFQVPKYCSFINYALHHYRVPSHKTSMLNSSPDSVLCRIGTHRVLFLAKFRADCYILSPLRGEQEGQHPLTGQRAPPISGGT